MHYTGLFTRILNSVPAVRILKIDKQKTICLRELMEK